MYRATLIAIAIAWSILATPVYACVANGDTRVDKAVAADMCDMFGSGDASIFQAVTVKDNIGYCLISSDMYLTMYVAKDQARVALSNVLRRFSEIYLRHNPKDDTGAQVARLVLMRGGDRVIEVSYRIWKGGIEVKFVDG